MPQTKPTQLKWHLIIIEDARFNKSLIMPALNAGYLDVQANEIYYRHNAVGVIFQTKTRKRAAIQMLHNWVPLARKRPGAHRRLRVNSTVEAPASVAPFRPIVNLPQRPFKIRAKLERLLLEEEHDNEESWQGFPDDDERAGASSEEIVCPLCGACKGIRSRDPWSGSTGRLLLNRHIKGAHPARHAIGYSGKQGIEEMLRRTQGN